MSENITLEIPDELAGSARAWAAAANRSLEDTLLEWLRTVAKDPPVESLPEKSLLALCDLQLPASQQSQLSELLARQREGLLAPADNERLDAILTEYRHGLVLKARAFKAAVERGLRPALGNGS